MGLIMMISDECTDERQTQIALNWVDFDLNVSSELSEKRSDTNSEEFFVQEEEEPCISIPIGHNINEEDIEEETEQEDDQLDDDDDLVTIEAISDPERELKEEDGSNLLEADNLKSKISVTVERGNTAIVDYNEAFNHVETASWEGSEDESESGWSGESLDFVTMRTNGSSSWREPNDSSDESSEDSETLVGMGSIK